MVRHTPPWKTPLLLGNIAHAVDRLVWQLNRLETPAARGDMVAAFRAELSHAEWRSMPEGVRLALAKASAARRTRARGTQRAPACPPIDDRVRRRRQLHRGVCLAGDVVRYCAPVGADAQPSTLPTASGATVTTGRCCSTCNSGAPFARP